MTNVHAAPCQNPPKQHGRDQVDVAARYTPSIYQATMQLKNIDATSNGT